SGATQPPARDDHPDAPPAGCGRRGYEHWDISLELGAATQAGVCSGHGALPVLSARVAADHRRHHAGRGDPKDPPASETCRRSTPYRTGACPPGSLRLVLRLTVPGMSQPPLGSLARGCHTAFVWSWACGPRSHRRWVVRADSPASYSYPQGVPRLLVCRTPCLGSVLHARTRVHQSLARARCPIVCTSLSHRPPAAPTALQELLHHFFAQSFKGSHRLESAPLGHCPSLGPRPPCRDDRQRQAAAVSRPACGVQRWPAAGALARLGSGLPVAWGGRWRAACWEAPTGGLA